MNRLLPDPHRQRGVGIVTAVFLLVVLAALGVAMVSVHTAQQQASALDVMGVRAYQAARAGAEWAVFRQRMGTGCAGSTTTFAMPAGTTLSAFSVTVSCTQVNQAAIGIDRFRMVSTACNEPGPTGCPNASPGPDYVQRVIDVRFGD